MGLPMIKELLSQLRKQPATNQFPARHLPDSVTSYLEAVGKGEAQITPPVPVPSAFRGKLAYNRDSCTGCGLCARVCPCNCIEVLKDIRKIRVYLCQCICCEQCTSVCQPDSLFMSEEFLTADTDRFSDNLILD
jgi:ferredoxin